MCTNLDLKRTDLKSVGGVQYEGDPQTIARASSERGNSHVIENNGSGDETVIKKRKTRRGKPKRRNPNPYSKPAWQQRKNNTKQAQLKYSRKYRSKLQTHGPAYAPYNSNQFLMEDHGNLQELDDKLNKSDGAGSSLNHPPRTRDSSFSVDSDADFYSSPEDEEEFLTKEFDHAYEDLQSERLQSMSKEELIVEYLQLENKVEILTTRLKGKGTNIGTDDQQANTPDSVIQQEMTKLLEENENLRKQNEILRGGLCRSATPLSSSVDSESDSSSSTCNSSSSTNESDTKDADMTQDIPLIDHSETNGYSPHPSSPNVV